MMSPLPCTYYINCSTLFLVGFSGIVWSLTGYLITVIVFTGGRDDARLLGVWGYQCSQVALIIWHLM